MKVVNHRLEGNNVVIQGSPNRGDVLNPDTIIIHYTAGPSAQSAMRTFLDPVKKSSTHLLVDFDGSVTHLVPFNRVAWHAGKSQHNGRVGLNQYSIGIEIVNAGRLIRNGAMFRSWFGRNFPLEEVFYGIHRNESEPTYWHQFTEAQITTVEEICETLVSAYNILHILGHEEVSPGHKLDPGPAFPLDKMRNKVLNINPRNDDGGIGLTEIATEGWVTANRLNIRSGPGLSQNRIAEALKRGQKVKILDALDNWYRVSTEIEGWVSREYIREAD